MVEAVTTMIGCLPTQALAFLAVFVYATYATHATQAIAFEWKPGITQAYTQTDTLPHKALVITSQMTSLSKAHQLRRVRYVMAGMSDERRQQT